ncbi:MAG: hypothetical protein H6925_03405 [Holosporaceae bacterium]|nr:MAG: hypothetical protein H6925_03405 [Holosporaceae bacterium]
MAGIQKRYGYGFKDDRFILHGPFMPKQMQKSARTGTGYRFLWQRTAFLFKKLNSL